MKYLIQLAVSTLPLSGPAHAHLALGASLDAWLQWFGNFHFLFVHFPIALIIMACIAELLFTWKKDSQYNFTVNFLLIAAAIFVIPTVLSGLSLAGSGEATSETNSLLDWHEAFGFITLTLTIITVVIRIFLGRCPLYLWSLFLLLICVLTTSHLGGLMAFGDFNLLPPVFNGLMKAF
jgi:uncharacterized membrane protein